MFTYLSMRTWPRMILPGKSAATKRLKSLPFNSIYLFIIWKHMKFVFHCTAAEQKREIHNKTGRVNKVNTNYLIKLLLNYGWHWVERYLICSLSWILPGPNFIELLSTKICLAWNFFLDKNRITNHISICCLLLVTGTQLLFAYPENHVEIWLVILLLSMKKCHA